MHSASCKFFLNIEAMDDIRKITGSMYDLSKSIIELKNFTLNSLDSKIKLAIMPMEINAINELNLSYGVTINNSSINTCGNKVIDLLFLSQNIIFDYVDKYNKDKFDDVVNKLCEVYLEIDNLFQDSFYFNAKNINVIKLARVIERISNIRHITKDCSIFTYENFNNRYDYKNMSKIDSVELLGGCVVGQGSQEFNLVFGSIDFDNIEKLSKHHIDGIKSDCFIMDKRFISLSGKEKIKIIPRKTYNVKCRVVVSPIKKEQTYYIDKFNMDEFIN